MINKRFLGKGGIVDYQTSNTAYDKLAFIADNYPDMVKMYDTLMAHLKLPSNEGGSECLFETKEVTFIPYYIAINKDFFEDNTTIPNPPGGSRTYDLTLTPKQIFGGTPEEIAKRLKGGYYLDSPVRAFSNAVYTDTVSRTTTRYTYNLSSGVYDNITETKEYYVFALNSPVQLALTGDVKCTLTSNLYKYYQNNRLLEQLFKKSFSGYSDNSGKSADANMFFFIMERNPRVPAYDSILCNCADMCKKYEDFTFTEVIPKGTAVMTYLGEGDQ